ncbi:putative zn(2)-C6 fungal-type DNA-binding domain-containing protein [Septoria linicola]|nr:putative zn(2)-C6 fungal-type DNA-binding domain-containing protein [Septoria linicola]
MSPDAEDVSSPEPGAEQDDVGTMGDDDKAAQRASTDEKSPSQTNTAATQPTKSNAKDPSRPRRKKARRACFACQRAHLTCGDERPCLRCIKRGLQDQCHDGVRKKAKYLHDAPAEALVPGYAGNTYALNGTASLAAMPGTTNVGSSTAYYPQNQAGSFPPYNHTGQQAPMGPPMIDGSNMMADFASTQTIETPTQYHSSSSQQVSPNQEFSSTLDRTPSIGTAGNLETPYFDGNDSSLFNFNISDLNFGNHYGALEFGMLGHMSSGAVNTPDVDAMNQLNHSNQSTSSFDNNNGFQSGYGYHQGFPSWSNPGRTVSRQNSTNTVWTGQTNGLEAYAIGEQASSITGASPHSQNQDFTGYQSATMSPETQFAQPDQNAQSDLLRQSLSQAQRKQPPFPGDLQAESDRKRRRNTSEVYTTVTAPYPYTQGFHALTALLKKRFVPKKVLHIAKALATIRPSFISCNQHLNNDDLIFMEKCFQRTLCEYESFVNSYGTPTVICRRTGEIAAVSKEFCLVTGWRRDVLLGKEANLNVNTGGVPTSGTQTGTSSRGAVTPRMSHLEVDSGRPQPVFLAELMDEDSVVQFYEDFAELAFGASKTAIIGAPCALLKYRTKDDPGWGPNDHLADDGKRIKKPGEVKTEPLIRGEAGMNALGERDGRVDCQMCWTVKRDVFDIPMLIVMNFLPII